MTKRRQTFLLPQVHQTDALKRFFDSTVDQVFQDGKTVPVSGYIGRKPAYYDPAKDFYKPEPTAARTRYQLEPVMISKDTNGNVTTQLFYEDCLARLGQEGALTNNPQRLFQAGYYSWAPPIDIDRIMNFQQYYWAGSNTTALELVVPGVEIGSRAYANGVSKVFDIPKKLPSRTSGEEQITVLLNGVVTTAFTASATQVTLSSVPAKDTIVAVYRYGNVASGSNDTFAIPAHCVASQGLSTVYVFLNGRETMDFVNNGNNTVTLNEAPAAATHVMVTRIKSLQAIIEGHPQFNPQGLTLNTKVTEFIDGLKVRLVDPENFQIGYDLKAYGHPWDEIHYSTFFVEGVDISIKLVPVDNITLNGDGLDGDDPRYIVVARSDRASSYWSRVNRWVHKDALLSSDDATYENRAKRPIIEFLEDLQQFNTGNYRVRNTSGKVSALPLYNGQPIPLSSINGLPVGSVTLDDGFVPIKGDVIFVNLPSMEFNSKLFYVDSVEDDAGEGALYLLEPVATVSEGAITAIKTVEYWFDGRRWNPVPEAGDFPIFDLFDADGISLSDEGVYPDTDFAGSRLFNFAKGVGALDSDIKRSITYDKYGQIMFENELETKTYGYSEGMITGYYYYRRGEAYENMWHRANTDLEQQIDDNNVSEIPLNLQANPDFESPQFLSRNDFFAHFTSILENQVGFEGQSFARNNWYLTAKDVTKGLVVIQHEAPLLKLMAILQERDLSITKAMKFVDREYSRFKAKFLKHVIEIGQETDTSILPPEALAEMAIKRINAGKTQNFPFNDSLVGGKNYFIPLTPALMGISPLFKPEIYSHDGFGKTISFVRGHDGSSTSLFGDLRDEALLALETIIFNAAEAVEDLMPLNTLVNGNFRTSALYSEAEMTRIMTPMFEGWGRENNITLINDDFDEGDPFSWNYGSSTDRYGNACVGNWRGIYRHYFDTDKPHLAPWEMLGFAQMPIWWTGLYGTAPYTRSNTILWDDIQAGIIRDGERQGQYADFARADLMQILPVDDQGALIDPFAATIVLRVPPVQFARQNWTFGDGSPAEALWRNTSSFQYSLVITKFLMRPNFFVERFWDVLGTRIVHETQSVDAKSLKRNRHAAIYVNGETQPDGTVKRAMGVQNWIIDSLISKGLAPSRLGEIVRGLASQLGHKIAGFTTSDRMTITAESFGLVPTEDIAITLYQSPSQQDFFYSGVLIENVAGGWRVVGYDAINPFFTIIPGEPGSRKVTISNSKSVERPVNPWTPSVYYKKEMLVEYGNTVYRCISPHTSGQKFEKTFWVRDILSSQRAVTSVFRLSDASDEIQQVEYGTILRTKQEVADLLFGFERYLVQQGFVFTETDADASSWTTAVLNFLKWSEVKWAENAFVTLSPAARELTYRSPTGIIVELDDAVVDRTGHTIKKQNVSVDRFEDTTVIVATAEDIYGARLSKSEIEHCLVFSNRTIFDDVIYDALFNVRQDRLKVSARLAGDWTGRYSAPGFVLQGNDMTPNFVKLGDDIREMFDIELADNTILRDHARHVIGFETREYLDKLLMNETQQFELYQGMIQQKGSAGALGSILRSDQIGQNRNLEFLEEWAFRVGDFGAYFPNHVAEFSIRQSDIHADRQVVHFGTTSENNWLDATSRWVGPESDFADLAVAETRESFADAGYARLDEAEHYVRLAQDIDTLMQEQEFVLDGERVWITHSPTWDIGRLSYPTDDHDPIAILVIDNEMTGAADGVEDFRVVFDREHNLVVGDTFYLSAGSSPEFRGGHVVLRAGSDWVETDTLSAKLYGDVDNNPPTVLVFRSLKVSNITALQTITFGSGTFAYVDNLNGRWAVYKKIAGDWSEVRRQPNRIENTKMVSSVVYDTASRLTETSLSVEPQIGEKLVVVDPFSGLIPGVADRELDYKVEYDPADYLVWGKEEVGLTWWDVSTARFINCYTDALEQFSSSDIRYIDEMNYRSSNWSRIMPTSSVDIYEWTRSVTIPEEVFDYVTHQEYDARLSKTVTAYYYWSLNPSTTPRADNRRLSALSVSEIIQNPAKAGLIWLAAISPKAMILSGIKPYLSDTAKVMQVEHQATDYQGDEHSEWLLMRPKDKSTPPDATLWNKLLSSLKGFDSDFKPLPASNLHETANSGLGKDQSMFGTTPVQDARKSFIVMLNYILARRNLSLIGLLEEKLSIADAPPENVCWSVYSGEQGILPLASEFDFTVYDEADLVDACARHQHVLLDNRAAENPSFSVWESDAAGKPALRKSYDYVVNTIAERDELFASLKFKDRVLVLNDSRAYGFWTIWTKNGDGAWAIDPFETFLYDGFGGPTLGISNAQKYRTRDMWYYVDWYSDAVSITNPPSTTYASIADRTASEGDRPLNEFVKVLDDGGYWSWMKFTDGEWLVVARENGTIQLHDDFYTSSKVYGFDGTKQDLNILNISKRNGVLDLQPLMAALVASVLTVEEMNELWFSMVHYIHATLNKVDWASKTSFLSILGFNERLWRSPVAFSDNMPLLLDYIDEVKPYRVKVREVLRTAAPDIDVANVHPTDFDKPVYYDPALDSYRRLDSETDADLLVKGLYRYGQENPDKVRRTKIGMLFDRIWSEPTVGSGAAARIMAYYQPGSNMRAKSLPELFNLDFQGTVYDGKSFAEIERDIDLRGSSAAESQKPLNVDGGLKMRDPHSVGKPEEMVKVGACDGVVFRIHDRWGKGAPLHTVRYYDVARRRAASATFDINVLVDSVAVFRDGVRAPDSAFTFNCVTHSVEVDLVVGEDRVQEVAIHGFGFAAVDRISDQQYYSGGQTIYTLKDAYTGLVEAHVDGVLLSGDKLSIDIDEVTITPAPANGSVVMLTLYTTDNPNPIRQKVTALPYRSDKTWQLTDLPAEKPYCANMIVEVNGFRLTPPKTLYVTNELTAFVATDDVAKLKVYDTRDGTYQSVTDLSAITTDTFTEALDVIAVLGSTRFALWDQRIVFADPDANARDYIVVIEGLNDFTISDTGQLIITKALSPSDTISVTQWTNSTLMDIRTHVYHGVTSGIYPLTTKKNGRAWLTIGGRRLVENIDYTIIGTSGSAWDIDAFEAFTYDSFQTVQIALKLPGEAIDKSVVITTFEGRENNAASMWQLSTKMPDEMRMLPMAEGETPLYVVRDAWEIVALDEKRRSASANAPVGNEDISMVVTVNPKGIPLPMMPSQPLPVPHGAHPGVIWLDGERIEYFDYSRSGNTITIGQMRRGTRGTAATKHEAGTILLAGDADLDRLPPCPLGEGHGDCCC